MKSLMTVISFTIKDMVKRKSFIISNIIILLIVVIGFNVPNWIKGENIEGEKLTIVDKNDIFGNTLENYKEQFMQLGYKVQIQQNSSKDEIENKIKQKEIDSALIVTENEMGINFEYMIDGVGISTTPQIGRASCRERV